MKLSILFINLAMVVGLCNNGIYREINEFNTPVPEPEKLLHRIPIGMNLPELTYYTPSLIFNDVMTTASPFMTYRDGTGEWDTNDADYLEVDENGYPLGLPQQINGRNLSARFLINNNYSGLYRVIFDGKGTLGGFAKKDSKGYLVELNGSGSNVWLDIKDSNKGNHIRNIHIIPEKYRIYDNYSYEQAVARGDIDTFNEGYLGGLEEFHALRFMDWNNTNNSSQMYWEERSRKTDYSQAIGKGISYEYAIELCNEIRADAWICIPHMASDEYIKNMAMLWRDYLDPELKVYLEFSNEIWNWQFYQTHWIANNGSWPDYDVPISVDAKVISDLKEIDPGEGMFPEKGAYMMARVFSIWSDVFIDKSRLVRVATAQHGWPGNTERILQYLFDRKNQWGGIGCDALSVGGYFGFGEEIHNDWIMKGADLDKEYIYNSIYNSFINFEQKLTLENSAIARNYNVDYIVYEGGQHMQPFNQDDWEYNQVLWDFQIDEYMYKLYMHNFQSMIEAECSLFMAYSYIGKRESRWGSWGHLEDVNEYLNIESNPKYKALIDINTSK